MRRDVQNSAKLFLSNELVLSRVYGIWAFVCILLFGFFAISSLASSMTKKVALYKEMRALNHDLNVKLQSINKLSEDISTAEKYIPLLEATIPQELNTHTYMVAFMQQAATAGFGVTDFVPASESADGEVPIMITLEGAGDLSALISGVEGMQRVTVVDSVKYEIHTDSTQATLYLRIFNL
ncbi:MAG: hypothetical protein UU64_C0005G0030 [candidate division WWE3 bacterium GW2011_GWF2_41_45]|uniref:Uncharacterized protein n=3 Tax=Katanobacteria TaxID=422282 RepID=A0A1F4W4W9_UNCKA|nr:MAG: hypothetical protein UU55_C0015G0008 [candidate division WWE3 bacterium GW2011_GWC2_41_23]KKS10369.1 MAG: hypothetical protein UU64_C0005G0030 [candidate division WWE3 bacterium GW2011_GWF2_41_45]KKS27643.1 MAG: hypothetical protein UU86_C0017G0018 [candidate division WWE3 bacterium GW2011_GWC1_42_102]KKS28319.1 MAG: hypothetical protein UU90_C0030G0016 [candidate division WWE3 bacterium GW2011_GWD2_42_11]KKS50409.1 MAG: hypothetical protein UV16_C0012G0017 [candidate division WWE3 bact